MEHLLGDMALFSQQCRIWIESSKWLEQLALTPDGRIPGLLQHCRSRLSSVPWNTVVPGFSSAVSFTTRSLATLLSYQWLDDEIMNAGAEYIMWQLGLMLAPRLLIASFRGTFAICVYTRRYMHPKNLVC